MIEKDAVREERILMEAVADANGPEEQAMGWYYYLDDKISFPFVAECIAANISSEPARNELCESLSFPIKRIPLESGERVTVVGMAGEDHCEHEMYVDVSWKWKGKVLAVPLVQLSPLDADKDTIEAIGDWHYWSKRGYTF